MAKNQNEILPLSDSVYYIMISLVEPLHGYAIMQKVEEITSGEIKIGPATLYTSLTKLQERQLIEARGDIPQSDDRRKPYTLTIQGAEILRLETKRREHMLKHGITALEKLEVDRENQR